MVGSWDDATCHTLTVPEAEKLRRPKIDGRQSFARSDKQWPTNLFGTIFTLVKQLSITAQSKMRGSFVLKIPVRKAGLALCLLEPAPLKFCDTLIAVNAAAGTRKWFQGASVETVSS